MYSVKPVKAFSSKGELKELFLLFLPLLGTCFSNYLFLLVEKLFLTRVSPLSMQAAINAAFAYQIFQGTLIALSMMAQVFVARWYGAREYSSIGPGIWQFLWVAVLSMLITVPLSLSYGSWYFSNTEIELQVWPYYKIFVYTNFLYPLGASLSCFFLGQGRTKLVLVTNAIVQVLKIVLGYVLIFGFTGKFEGLGLIGGAISTTFSQSLYCLILFLSFLSQKNREEFRTGNWKFKPFLCKELISPCLLRAVNRISNFLSWASIAHLMKIRGGDYLLILSLGGSITMFLPFIFEAICQAQTTTVSYLLGGNKKNCFSRANRSGFVLTFIVITILAMLFLGFPLQLFDYLFPGVSLAPKAISKLFFGGWLSFSFFTLSAIPVSYVLAHKDMLFSFGMGAFNWINGYLLMYICIEKFQILPENFWICLSLMHGSTFILYLLRMRMLSRKDHAEPLLA